MDNCLKRTDRSPEKCPGDRVAVKDGSGGLKPTGSGRCDLRRVSVAGTRSEVLCRRSSAANATVPAVAPLPWAEAHGYRTGPLRGLLEFWREAKSSTFARGVFGSAWLFRLKAGLQLLPAFAVFIAKAEEPVSYERDIAPILRS